MTMSTTAPLTGELIAALRRRVGGPVVLDGEPGYDDARTVWNAMIDRRPAAVVRAATVGDIEPVVAFARETGLPLAVRGGGHNVAGNGTVDGGIVLDLGSLNRVEVDEASRTVRVPGGATLADVDRATTPHGLAVPLGVISGTGVGGLTLGGGVGWLTRAHGLTIDNLLGADVVTADGATVRASAEENPELFWGIRGGGGNFGVVSSFTFRAHPLGPVVYAGNLVYGAAHWVSALRAYEEWTRDLPDAMTSILTFITPPPALEMGDEPLMIVGFAWASPDHDQGRRVLEPLLAAAPPDDREVGPTDWPAWQSAMDAIFPKGVRAYWKNTSFDRMDDEVIAVLARRAAEQTWLGTAFDVHHLGGAFARVPEHATPFPHRSARFWINIYGFWTGAEDDAARTAFVRDLAAELAPFATGGQYVNFLGAEEVVDRRGQAEAVYGPEKLERLVALKRRYDPANLFRLNHNIPPG